MKFLSSAVFLVVLATAIFCTDAAPCHRKNKLYNAARIAGIPYGGVGGPVPLGGPLLPPVNLNQNLPLVNQFPNGAAINQISNQLIPGAVVRNVY